MEENNFLTKNGPQEENKKNVFELLASHLVLPGVDIYQRKIKLTESVRSVNFPIGDSTRPIRLAYAFDTSDERVLTCIDCDDTGIESVLKRAPDYYGHLHQVIFRQPNLASGYLLARFGAK